MSDTFGYEKFYSFTVTVNEDDLIYSAKISNPDDNEKKRLEGKGTIELFKVNRDSRAELRIWPSS